MSLAWVTQPRRRISSRSAPSKARTWYAAANSCPGIKYLETVPAAVLSDARELRFPVQYVIRNGDFRGFAGQIASGTLRQGDTLMALPSGRTSRVHSIVTWDGDLQEASAPLSVTVRLEDEIDISRGDMLVSPDSLPAVSGTLEATLVWMSEQPLRAGRPYLLKHAAQTIRVRVREGVRRIDMGTLAEEPASSLALNDIGHAVLVTERPLFFDRYQANRATGSLILVDPITNETVAAGMIAGETTGGAAEDRVTEKERRIRNGHRPALIVVESHEAALFLERKLFAAGNQVIWLQGESNSAVLALYNAGFVVILSQAVELTDLPMEAIHLSKDRFQNPDQLMDTIHSLIAVR